MVEIPNANAVGEVSLDIAALILEHTNVRERTRLVPAFAKRVLFRHDIVQSMHMHSWDFTDLTQAAHWLQSEPGTRGMPPEKLAKLIESFGPSPTMTPMPNAERAALAAAAEKVDHPSHYGGADNPYETLKVMVAWHPREWVIAFCVLSAEKYISRAGKKSSEPDYQEWRKGAFYLNYAADLREGKK